MPEFGQHGLEILRQPLEGRTVTISRAVSPSGGSLTFPANFILVGAQNPCPCGYWGDLEHDSCTLPAQRLSGPLLDLRHLPPPDSCPSAPTPGGRDREPITVTRARTFGGHRRVGG